MGYDPTRFIGEIVEEFLCSICTFVLENPVQSYCEHMFCMLCIEGWLLRNQCCPDDRKSLTSKQLKAPGRIIRNLLNKLIIKCDFHRKGCRKLVMLEYLEDHRERCQFNPIFAMANDTGNKNPIHSIVSLKRDPVQTEKRRSKTTKVKVNVHLPAREFKKEMKQQQKTPNPQPNRIRYPDISEPWKELCNFKVCDGTLEVESKSVHAFAQSSYAIEPTDPSFKIKILNFDRFKYMAIGLTSKGHQIDQIPGLYGQSIGCDSSGDFIADKISKRFGTSWSVGDVIECGIRFSNNATDNSESSQVKVYFCKNGEIIAEKKVPMPTNGFFPTVYIFEGVAGSWWNSGEICSMGGTGTKVEYFK